MPTRFAFVSTYPPTACGLATFTSALRHALVRNGTDEGVVVRLVDAPAPRPGPEVIAQIVAGDPVSLHKAVGHLNACDVVIVQHDFDVFGGRDADDVLTLLDGLEVPSIVVLHAVLGAPSHHQREVLEAVVAKAGAVVVLTQSAHDRLAADYAVELAKVRVISHGAREMRATTHTTTFRSGDFSVLTWGLLGPGKGIEHAIEAMALLGNEPRRPRYLVAGATHPKILAKDGQAYRDGLVAQVHRLELGVSVNLDGHYRDAASLAHLVRSADVVLLPDDDGDRVASAVLVEAVGAGKPVIATDYPHTRELLADGAGLLVPVADPAAIAGALRIVMTRGDLVVEMARAAAAAAPALMWPAVAEQYRALAAALIVATVAA